MSDLYNGIHEYNSNDIGGLILPTSFEDALSYDQQILWLYLYKQALLQAGDNIELHENTDGTVTISSTGGGATYTIRSTTPDSGFGSAYELVNVDTGERAGSKINIPEAIDGVGITSIVFKQTDAQGNNVYTVNLTDGSHYDIVCPKGAQGVAGQDGRDGQNGQDGTNGIDGVGITSITFKETDAQGNNIYTVNLTNSTSYDITCPKGPQGATGATGAGVPTGGTTGQVLSKVSGTAYDTQWRDVHEVPSGGTAGQVLSKVDGTDYNVQWETPSGGFKYHRVNISTQINEIALKASDGTYETLSGSITCAFNGFVIAYENAAYSMLNEIRITYGGSSTYGITLPTAYTDGTKKLSKIRFYVSRSAIFGSDIPSNYGYTSTPSITGMQAFDSNNTVVVRTSTPFNFEVDAGANARVYFHIPFAQALDLTGATHLRFTGLDLT